MAGGMTFHAVDDFLPADSFFQVLLFHLLLAVFMAVVAGVFGIGGGVAGFAGDLAPFAVIERKPVVGQLGRLPGLRPYGSWRSQSRTRRHGWSILHGR